MTTKKRNPFLAFISSLLMPGLGYIYIGAGKKGLTFCVLPYVVIAVTGLTGIITHFYGGLVTAALAFGFYIYAIIDSTIAAIKRKEHPLNPYNRWYYYILIWIIYTTISSLLLLNRGEYLGYETFRTASDSMTPALQTGDYIMVDTKYTTLHIGDIIAYKNPKNPHVVYAKRVAALNNDVISILNGEVVVNNQIVKILSVPPENRKQQSSILMNELTVNKNEVFVLGDNRDNSNDSRQTGTIPTPYIVGKVKYIWYSNNLSRAGITFE